MAFGPGFNYIQGKYELRWSLATSAQTIQAGNVVTLDAGRRVIIADSDSTAITGVAAANSANSLSNALSSKIPVIVAYPDTVFAAPIQGAAASATSIGQSYNIEGYLANGNLHHRVDTDSAATPMVTLVQRGYDDNAVVDSAESVVYVQFLGDRLGMFNSNASVSIFAQT
jgi:hypothetical protein